MFVTGTGGVVDTASYLNTRVDLHRQLAGRALLRDADKVFCALDLGDLDSFLAYLDPDAELRFGSQTAVRGHLAIREYIERFTGGIGAMEHRLETLLGAGHHIVAQGSVTYQLKTGDSKRIPFCDLWTVGLDGKIKSYHIYCDPTGLF